MTLFAVHCGYSRRVTETAFSSGLASSASPSGDARPAGRAPGHAHYDEALRRGILIEALERLRDNGPESLGLRPLAASQGTSTTAIYTMFGGKAGLLAAVAAEADSEFTNALRESLRYDSVVGDMRSLCRSYRRWALEQPGLYGLLIDEYSAYQESSSPRPSALAAPRWREPLLEVVDALVDEGVFRSTDVHETATAIWASLHGIVSLEMSVWRQSPSAEHHFETQLAAILRSWTTGASRVVVAG